MEEYSLLIGDYLSSINGSLSENQKTRLEKILQGFDPRNMAQRVLFSAGYKTIKAINRGVVYAGIRGSVSRGGANEKDDVDLLFFYDGSGEEIRKMKEEIKEIAYENGVKAKRILPCLERPEKRIVTFCVFGKEDYEKFKSRPWLLDMENIDFQREREYVNATKIIGGISQYMERDEVLSNPHKDPFEFLERMLKVFVRVPAHKKKLWRKVFNHYKNSIVFSRARLEGIQIKGDVPQHKLTKTRDEFIKGFLLPNAYVLDF